MTDLTMSQFASKDDLLAAQAARIAELESQLEAIGAGGVEPLRKPAAAPQAVQAAVPEAIEQMAVDRYKVVPSHESMFHRWAVVADNGAQQLYIGREGECQNMARKFMGAFLDGAFVAMQNATPAHPAEGVPASVIAGAVFDFAGYLTTLPHKEAIHCSEAHEAAPMVEAITEWCKRRNLTTDGAKVETWRDHLAEAPAHPAEGVPAQAGPVGYVALAALTSRTHADDYAPCFATEAALIENYPAAKVIAVYDHAATQPAAQGLDAGSTDADRVIGRLLSSDPDFEDCTEAANLIRELTQNGPDGFATWKDAALAERVLRVDMQHAIRALPRVTYGYKSDGEGRYLTSYESSEGQFLRRADVMAAIAAQAKKGEQENG